MYAFLLVFGPTLMQSYASLARRLEKKVPHHSFDLSSLLEIYFGQLSTHWLGRHGDRGRKTIPVMGFVISGLFDFDFERS